MGDLSDLHGILTLAWWAALNMSLLLYILLDGADLGAGIFSLCVRSSNERAAIMSAMAGTWDANETWLIVAGGVLFGSFPFVYGSAFSYLMIPLAVALWGMITRALSLELRHLATVRWQRFSDICFGLASLITTFAGGMAVGAIFHGYPLTHTPGVVPTYVGGSFRFISVFSVWTGIAAVIAVTLSGVLFIRVRFEHGERIREQAASWTAAIFHVALAAVGITVVLTALTFQWAAQKWFGPHFWIWGLVLVAAVATTFKMRVASRQDRDVAAMLWLAMTVSIMAVAMLATLYPWLVPNTWTIYSGASPAVSLFTFILAMGGFFPVILMYNAYQIWVFRARITALAAYR